MKAPLLHFLQRSFRLVLFFSLVLLTTFFSVKDGATSLLTTVHVALPPFNVDHIISPFATRRAKLAHV